jgi:hypothetical protein
MPPRREGTLVHLWRIVALGSFPRHAPAFCHPSDNRGMVSEMRLAIAEDRSTKIVLAWEWNGPLE